MNEYFSIFNLLIPATSIWENSPTKGICHHILVPGLAHIRKDGFGVFPVSRLLLLLNRPRSLENLCFKIENDEERRFGGVYVDCNLV